MATIPGQVCYQSDYLKELNIYGIFCFKQNEGSAGYYYFHIVDRAAKKVTGSSSYDRANLNST